MNAPCKDCEKREVGCQCKCKSYLKYHANQERESFERALAGHARWSGISFKAENIRGIRGN
jgi:hypothetical protein